MKMASHKGKVISGGQPSERISERMSEQLNE